MQPRHLMINNLGHKGALETESRVYSCFVWKFPHQTSHHSQELVPGTPFASVWDSGRHFAPLTFPRSQATEWFTEIICQRGNPSEEVTERELPPRWDCQTPHSRRGKRKESVWDPELSLQCGLEARGRCCQPCAEHRGMEFAFSWGFYLCWHGNKLVPLFISSVKVL